MKVDLDKTFEIPGSSDKSWTFLQNIPGVASCMPGAEITEEIDENNFKGKVKAKVGPATMAFTGHIEIQSIDLEKRQLHLIGKGQDTKGTSSATMDLTAWVLDGDAGKSTLRGEATVSVTGKAASLGGRMMTQVADQILNQFGKNYATNVAAMGDTEEAEQAKEALKEQPKELNGLAFGWALFTGWFKGLFSKKQAN